jgi:ribonucleases P/MRP protein subunit RPP40
MWLSRNQHGFRHGHSCETQLTGLVEDITDVLDESGELGAVFLDFEKAFDKVPHMKLIKKLEGVIGNGRVLRWVIDFLRGRVQRVNVENVESEEEKVTSGVPQGSVLGPLLFIIYINDIDNGVVSRVRLFADDCALYRRIESDADIKMLQQDLETINEWVKLNKMSLNVNKCKAMCFSRKQNKSTMTLKIMGTSLEEVDSYKYLGVTLHEKMNWTQQVERISRKATKNLNFVMRNLKGSKKEIREKAYLTLIRPILDYAGAIWDPYLEKHIKTIEEVQRMAARRVLNKWRKWSWIDAGNEVRELIHDSPSSMIQELNWIPLAKRRKTQRLCNMYRIISGKWVGWYEMETRLENSNYLGRHDHQWKMRETQKRKDVGKFSFWNKTIKEWNEQNNEIMEEWPRTLKEYRKKMEENAKNILQK